MADPKLPPATCGACGQPWKRLWIMPNVALWSCGCGDLVAHPSFRLTPEGRRIAEELRDDG